jgi:hypothetical protein
MATYDVASDTCQALLDGVPHALFTVWPDISGAPTAGFPGGARVTHDSTDVAAAMREACQDLGFADVDSLQILGLTSDCPDVPRQTAVTPVVGYLGRAAQLDRFETRVETAYGFSA